MVHLRIPGAVVDPVENAAEFLRMGVERGLQAMPQLGVLDLLGIARRNGGDEIRIDDAALHDIDRADMGVVAQFVRRHQVTGFEAALAQDERIGHALVADVVQGVAHPRMAHAHGLIHLVQEHGQQAGLPVMAVDDVGLATGLEHILQHRAGEKSEACRVVVMPIVGAAIEKVLRRHRLDEQTGDVVHPAAVDVAANPAFIVRHPEIGIALLQVLDAVVAHTVVHGKIDFHCQLARQQIPGQPVHHVGQPADLGHRCTFRCDQRDVHLSLTPTKVLPPEGASNRPPVRYPETAGP